MDSKLISFYKNVSIVIPILYSPCLLVVEIIEMTGGGFYLRSLILFNLFLLAVYSYKKSHYTKVQKNVIWLIIILLLYFLFLGITIYQGSSFTIKTPIKNYTTVIFIFIIINGNNFNLTRLIRLFITISFIFSFLAVLQLVLYYFGMFKPFPYYFKTYDAGGYRGVGFGGFISGNYSMGNLYRIESFWREPARFAQFLQASIFLSLHQYITKKSIKKLFVLITLITAFFLTFSVANLFAVFFGLILFFTIARKDLLIKFRVLRKLSSPIFVVILIYGAFSFYNFTQSSIYDTGSFLSKKTDTQFENRLERFYYASSVLNTSFWGNPDIRLDWKRNPSAIGMMIVWSGIPGALLAIILSIVFFRSILIHIRKSKYSMVYLGSITFFIAFNWYGSYFDNYFLFIIALYLVMIKYDIHNKSFLQE
jgi:hypothetical protein